MAAEGEGLGRSTAPVRRDPRLGAMPSRAAGALPPEDLSVSIEYQDRGAQRRLLTAQAHSSTGDKLLEQILAATSQ